MVPAVPLLEHKPQQQPQLCHCAQPRAPGATPGAIPWCLPQGGKASPAGLWFRGLLPLARDGPWRAEYSAHSSALCHGSRSTHFAVGTQDGHCPSLSVFGGDPRALPGLQQPMSTFCSENPWGGFRVCRTPLGIFSSVHLCGHLFPRAEFWAQSLSPSRLFQVSNPMG